MAHRCHRATCSQGTVLTSPDLLERILALLPEPVLWLGSKSGTGNRREREPLNRPARVTAGDRWAAGQVSRAFRQAALRLPWEAYLEAYTSRPNISEDSLALICGPRKLATVRVSLLPEAIASCAALLCHASSVQVLRVGFNGEDTLSDWLQHSQGASPCQGMSVQARLSTLSRLTNLALEGSSCASWSRSSWLTAAPHLRALKLCPYTGPPVGVLPRLQSLDACYGYYSPAQQRTEHDLVEWAQPRLTALTLSGYRVRIGSLVEGSTEQGGAAWLSQLQRLSLDICFLSVHSVGLRTLVPKLTYLNLSERWDQDATDPEALVPRGLPLSLKELHLSSKSIPVDVVQSAVSVLSNLVSVKLKQWWSVATNNDDEINAALQSLTVLPKLELAVWVVWSSGDLVEHSWDRASGALRRSRPQS